MKHLDNISIKAVLAGILINVLLMFIWQLVFKMGENWSSWAISFIAQASTLAPGFFAGWVAGRRGLVHGCLVSIGYAILTIGHAVLFGEAETKSNVINFSIFFFSSLSLITTCVAAIAGVGVRRHGFAF